VGCATCHSGAALGATSYRKAASLRPWPAGGGDLGRFEISRQEADRGVFKVPTLRNIARTDPYFHDASAATLDEAVRRMAAVQHDRDLTAEQVSAVVTFLGALTGELPTDLIQKPELPKSSVTTPLPDPN
jgi:cytochrome c peroxidase